MKSVSLLSGFFSILFVTSLAQAECNFTRVTGPAGTYGAYACNQDGTHYGDLYMCTAQCGQSGNGGGSSYTPPEPKKKCSAEFFLRGRLRVDKYGHKLCYQKFPNGSGGYVFVLHSGFDCDHACYDPNEQQ